MELNSARSGDPSIHRIDSRDRLCFVNEPWQSFAKANGLGIAPEAVLGRPLWQFIAGADVADLFRALLGRVRSGERSLRLPFRCDAPDMRRDMEMEVLPLAGGVVEFRSHLGAQGARDAVALLDAAEPRANWYTSICSWCKRLKVDAAAWQETEAGVRTLGLFTARPLPRLAHTICPDCAREIGSRVGK